MTAFTKQINDVMWSVRIEWLFIQFFMKQSFIFEYREITGSLRLQGGASSNKDFFEDVCLSFVTDLSKRT